MIFKPSEFTPAVGEWLVGAWQRAAPDARDVLQLITGDGSTGAALCRAGVDKIAFTGSSSTGRAVMAACAENLIPVLMECGGKGRRHRHEAVRRVAQEIGGEPGGAFTDLANIPMTAHFLGGCVIGASPELGVVDPYQRGFGYPGLSVADGSAVSANLGVNPSLTITAQAERVFALWPNRGDPTRAQP